MRSALFSSLFGGFVATAALVLALGAVPLVAAHEASVHAQSRSELRARLGMAVTLISAESGRLTLDVPALEHWAQSQSTRLTIIGRDGIPIFESQSNLPKVGQRELREVKDALAHGFGMDVHVDPLGSTNLYAAQALVLGGDTLGVGRCAWPMAAIEARAQALRRTALSYGGLGLALATAIGLWATRRAQRPLKNMISAAEAIASGESQGRVPESAGGDAGKLARAFNSMAAQLAERMDTITSDRNKLAAVLHGMAEGVVAVDTSDTLVHLNAAAARIFDLSLADCLGKRIAQIPKIGEISAILAKSVAQNIDVTSEIRLHQIPRDRRVEVHASPLLDGDGQGAGAVAVIQDVTELRRLEGIRRDFVANVSHELKTPITAIRGLIETMLDDENMDAGTRRRFIDRIQQQSVRLGALVAHLLQISRLETEEVILDRAPVDLVGLMDEVVKSRNTAAQNRQVALEADLPAPPLVAVADDEGLRQIAGNLLDNALAYTPAGGRIWLRLRADGGFAEIEVEDTGVGIAPEHIPRIFERFYRVDKGRSRDLGGTGLGLSIVKHLALSHGGDVSVKSQPGKGSCFRVRIPL